MSRPLDQSSNLDDQIVKTSGFGVWSCLFLVLATATAWANDDATVLRDVEAQVHLKQLCIECHNAKKAKGKIRLDLPFSRIDEASWSKIVQVLHHVDMPPTDERQPSRKVRSQLEAWAQGHLDAHILKRAGDPGAVAWRRLTAIELNNMVRDLTGHSMDAGRHFPTENFGGEGFSNIGNVQNALSGSVLDKYLAMADEVARHARFDQRGGLVFDAPGSIQAPEVRRDQALSDIKLTARQACGYLYLGSGKLIGGEGDERSLDGAFKKAAQGWDGPGRYLEALWITQAARDPRDAMIMLADKRDLNLGYLRYLWHLRETCPPDSLEHTLWVEPLTKLPMPKSVDQSVPDDVSRACHGIGNSVWSCMVHATMHGLTRTPSSPYRTVGVGSWQLHIRLTKRTQERRDNKIVNVMLAPDRLTIVVDFLSPSTDTTTVYLGMPKLSLKEPDRDVFEEVNGKRVRKGRKRGEVREIVLDKTSFKTLPKDAQWVQHAFSKGDPQAALKLTRPGTLVLDISNVSKQLNPNGGNLDAFLPTHLTTDSGLVQLRHSGNGDRDADALARASADGNFARWLIANEDQDEAFIADWNAMFQRWFPPHPVTIAPFDGGRNTNGLPDEVQFYRDDARLKTQLLDASGRERMDHLWSNLYMLSGELRQRLAIFAGKYQIADLPGDQQIKRLADIQANPDQDEQRMQQRMNHPYGEIPVALPDRLAFYQDQMDQHRSLWRQRTLAAVTAFASQAWRRPLTKPEQARFNDMYNSMQSAADSDTEGVLRTMLMRVLVSPHFLFRCERIAAGGEEAPLNAWELATRLSLTIWASLPDDELRRLAADGSLLRDDILRQQTRRMLADSKARGMAEHFFGQWLGFAGFDRGKAGPDPNVFPRFTPQVRRSLHGEAVTFFEDLIRNDRDIRQIVNADYSFIDETLRDYYDVGDSKAASTQSHGGVNSPVSVAGFEPLELKSIHRGGVLGMASILIRNSRSRRTSPVNRGVWVVENLMGRHLPTPPADVPPIPDRLEQDVSLREQMVRHREVEACASCHARIDPFGFAFEAFDAAGQLRPKPFRDNIEYEQTRDGVMLDGVDALRNYLMDRSDQVHRNLIRRMLGYALNRSVSVSDTPLIDRTLDELPRNKYRFSTVVENIVLSRQFRSHRPATEREFATTD